MRKPRGGQILANRVIGPREVLGGGDRRVPAKGRGRTEPHRGRSGASWIWSTPLHTGASEGEFRSGYALTPSPSHSKNISLFTERRTSERTVSEDGYSSFLFNPLWGFPVVAAGILFVVDQTPDSRNVTGCRSVGAASMRRSDRIRRGDPCGRPSSGPAQDRPLRNVRSDRTTEGPPLQSTSRWKICAGLLLALGKWVRFWLATWLPFWTGRSR